MSDLLKKIYNNVLVYEEDIVKTNREIDEERNRLVECYVQQLSDKEKDQLKDIMSSMALTAEMAGFENGVRFAFQLLGSLVFD